MMVRICILAATAFVGVEAPAAAQSQSGKPVPTIPATQIEPRKVATPLEFVATASSGNAFEIEAGKLALSRSESAEVKSFAQMMIDDHSKAQEELVDLAKAATIEFGKPEPDGEQQGMLGKLDPLKGQDFDGAYVESQIYAHQRAKTTLAPIAALRDVMRQTGNDNTGETGHGVSGNWIRDREIIGRN